MRENRLTTRITACETRWAGTFWLTTDSFLADVVLAVAEIGGVAEATAGEVAFVTASPAGAEALLDGTEG